jgi:hypothetical protein
VGFLRRLLGRGERGDAREDGARADGPADATTSPEGEERAHELEMARFDQARTDDLVRRQQRYARYAWTPPSQGGDRRADDEAAPDGGEDARES